MKISKEEARSARKYLRRLGVCAVSAAVASMMVVPMASATDIGVASGNGYGINPTEAVGENTLPSTANGDTAYNLTNLTNEKSQMYIVGGCGGSGTASQDYLDVIGVSNIGSSGYNWGTKINENPNPFAWNDIMTTESNCSSAGQADSTSTGIGYQKAAWSGVMTYATCLKYRPQILATSNAGVATYNNIVKMIQEIDPSYNPTVMSFCESNYLGLTSLVDGIWNAAASVENMKGYGTSYITRYGDPEEIAQNLEAYTKATQWYILSKHEKQGTLKTVAYVTGWSGGKVTCTATDVASDTDIQARSIEGFEQITYNICNTGTTFTREKESSGTVTYTTTSLDDFKNVDVVFWAAGSGGSTGNPGQQQTTSNDSQESFQSALKAAGANCTVVAPSLAVGHQGFGLYRNLAEYEGYLYPEDIQLSYMLKYFWSTFGHVKDEYIDACMKNQDSSKLLPTGNAEIDLDTTGYEESYMTDIFNAGEKYYLANKDNSNSFCSHYRLAAQTTCANNNYTFGTYTPEKQVITVSPTSKTYKKATVAKKAQTFTISVKGAQGKVTYKSNKAKVTVTAKGKVTVKKGFTGTAKITVKAAACNGFSASAAKTVKVVVK